MVVDVEQMIVGLVAVFTFKEEGEDEYEWLGGGLLLFSCLSFSSCYLDSFTRVFVAVSVSPSSSLR